VAAALAAVGTAAQADALTSYDSAGRVSQARDMNGWWTSYGYDRAGRVAQTTNALTGNTFS
jgi:YD repeat-containing protein